jgi:hypothetical protein
MELFGKNIKAFSFQRSGFFFCRGGGIAFSDPAEDETKRKSLTFTSFAPGLLNFTSLIPVSW